MMAGKLKIFFLLLSAGVLNLCAAETKPVIWSEGVRRAWCGFSCRCSVNRVKTVTGLGPRQIVIHQNTTHSLDWQFPTLGSNSSKKGKQD